MDSNLPTLALGSFAADLRSGRLPTGLEVTLGEFLLDYLRVASIGARMPWSDWSRAHCSHLGGTGRSDVLFSTEKANPLQAAFLNAVYAGSIDSDDTHVGAMLHPGAVVFSAALAIGTEHNVSGRQLLAAVAAGYEAMIRIGLAIQPSHFQRGFQSTATCGGFGAATAAAVLLFDSEAARRISETLGIAASFAGGLTQFYQSGSTVKRIHAAHAAESGVKAALLVSSGFSGPVDILEGKNGFARAYADAVDFSQVTAGLGTDFRLLEVMVKVHACSARVQSAVEGMLSLGRNEKFDAEEIEEIIVGVPAVIVGRLTLSRPVDLQAAQMSLPFSVALVTSKLPNAGRGFVLDVADYEAGLSDASVRAIEDLVRCEVDPEVEAATTVEAVAAKVVVRLKTGREYSIFVDAPTGSPAKPLTHEEQLDRFERELTSRISQAHVASLIKIAENLADYSNLSELSELISCETNACSEALTASAE